MKNLYYLGLVGLSCLSISTVKAAEESKGTDAFISTDERRFITALDTWYWGMKNKSPLALSGKNIAFELLPQLEKKYRAEGINEVLDRIIHMIIGHPLIPNSDDLNSIRDYIDNLKKGIVISPQ